MELTKKNKIFNFKDYQLKTIINIHNNCTISMLIMLKDYRFASSSSDKSIKIFNRETYEIDMIIIEHTNYVSYINQLKDERLVSSSSDFTIKIFKLFKNYYLIEQIINNHKNRLRKTIELQNNYLVSCSWDKTIKIWIKDLKGLYKLKQELNEKNEIDSIFEINEKEICSLSYLEETLIFYELKNDKFIFNCSIDNYIFSGFPNNFAKINEKCFLIGGELMIYFIDINSHKIKYIYVFEKYINEINYFQTLYLSKDGFLFVGAETDIFQFKILENDLELIVHLKNIHDKNKDEGWKTISCIIEDINEDLITTSYDGTIKFWSKKN